WPSNVRQLKNCVSVACSTLKTTLTAPDFEIAEKGQRSTTETVPAIYPRLSEIDSVKRQLIVDALHSSHWNITAAAKKAGIARNTFLGWMKKFGISQPTEQLAGSQTPGSWEEG